MYLELGCASKDQSKTQALPCPSLHHPKVYFSSILSMTQWMTQCITISAVVFILIAGLLRDLGVLLNPSQLSQAIAQLDTSQTGRITFGEFLLWWKG